MYLIILIGVNSMIFFNIPILLTLFRVVMVPCFTVAFYLPVYWGPMLCAVMFFIAALTDWFDGFLARRWKQTTTFGKFLDPIADKIMIVTALILISEHFHVWWITLPTSTIIIREIIISALREWVARVSIKTQDQYNIAVSWISKLKTFIQMLSLIALLCRSDEWIIISGIITLYIAVLLTFWSMCHYLNTARYTLLNH